MRTILTLDTVPNTEGPNQEDSNNIRSSAGERVRPVRFWWPPGRQRECSWAAADAAEQVRQATMNTNRALSSISHDDSNAHERFDDAHRLFRARPEGFVEAARAAIGTPSL